MKLAIALIPIRAFLILKEMWELVPISVARESKNFPKLSVGSLISFGCPYLLLLWLFSWFSSCVRVRGKILNKTSHECSYNAEDLGCHRGGVTLCTAQLLKSCSPSILHYCQRLLTRLCRKQLLSIRAVRSSQPL